MVGCLRKNLKLKATTTTTCIVMSGALYTMPTSALEIVLHLPPLLLYYKVPSAKNGRLHCATCPWQMSAISHTEVLNDFRTVESIDYIVPQYDLTIGVLPCSVLQTKV